MAKATIKSKTGALITVQGSDSEVSRILTAFEQAEQMGQTKRYVTKVKVEKKEQKKRQSAFDLLIGLREEGFFKQARTAMDVHAKLQSHYSCALNRVAVALLRLQRRKLLRKTAKVIGKRKQTAYVW